MNVFLNKWVNAYLNEWKDRWVNGRNNIVVSKESIWGTCVCPRVVWPTSQLTVADSVLSSVLLSTGALQSPGSRPSASGRLRAPHYSLMRSPALPFARPACKGSGRCLAAGRSPRIYAPIICESVHRQSPSPPTSKNKTHQLFKIQELP